MSLCETVRVEGEAICMVWDIYSVNNRIAVFGHIPCPRENGLYERARLKINQCLREVLTRLKEDEGIEVLFIDVDKCMNFDCFVKDGALVRALTGQEKPSWIRFFIEVLADKSGSTE